MPTNAPPAAAGLATETTAGFAADCTGTWAATAPEAASPPPFPCFCNAAAQGAGTATRCWFPPGHAAFGVSPRGCAGLLFAEPLRRDLRASKPLSFFLETTNSSESPCRVTSGERCGGSATPADSCLIGSLEIICLIGCTSSTCRAEFAVVLVMAFKLFCGSGTILVFSTLLAQISSTTLFLSFDERLDCLGCLRAFCGSAPRGVA
mmetsp:Transcript_51036/g.142812  ORF Transcript_51036/g.142812 Transcript_51036/m.142812 type:complete len:206 (-) Transcript_51036:758-1375(-)